jgi:Cu-Zn family superoxide dismutase
VTSNASPRGLFMSAIAVAGLVLAACGGGGASPAPTAAASKPVAASPAASVKPAASASAKPAASASAKPAASAAASAKPGGSAPASAKPSGATATADVKNAQGQTIGTATFQEVADGVLVSGTFQGLPAGPHGWHIHETGKCDPPSFMTAGGHFNPTSRQHGAHNPQGFHAGDLGNIIFPAAGSVTIRALARGATLGTGSNGLLKPDGTSLVIHAQLDDDQTDPAGNSGDRVACGVITSGAAASAAASAKPAASGAAASAAVSAKPAGSAAAKPSA